MHDKILILDFGSQVTQLIGRRVREAQVYCEIHPSDVSDDFIRQFAPKGIILSGSHASTYEEQDLRAPEVVWTLGVPVLGATGVVVWLAGRRGRPRLQGNAPIGRAETVILVGSEGGTTWGFARTLLAQTERTAALFHYFDDTAARLRACALVQLHQRGSRTRS